MRKIGTAPIWATTVPMEEQFPFLKEVGFDCVMLSYFVGDDIAPLYNGAIKAGLEVCNIHGPISTVNSVWAEGIDGDDYIEIQKERINFCHSAGIPTVVLHTTFLKNPPPVSDIGIERHKRLCDYAENKGVHLAFENVEPYPHLDAVIKNVSDFHGFCWDVGHNNVYAPTTDYMAKYADRLTAVHIHDNHGAAWYSAPEMRGDKHWIPFDGSIDWEKYAEKLNSSVYDGPLTLEISLGASEEYKKMTFEELAVKYHKGVSKLREIVEKSSE
ncbi:MAG: sugar phosphate isomerase/epimerase [Clostridia bacterium]|nr:sugar phosphate isomerase/epimerase [Clostridia bacterium]